VKRLEDYLISSLIDFNDLNYDDHTELLYKLTGQVVARLRSYLPDEKDVINVLQFHQQTLVNLIYSQMQQHYLESATVYEAQVTRGFCTLRAVSFSIAANEKARNFRVLIPDGMRNQITSMAFEGFAKCLYPIQKFDSDSERRLAVLLENDPDVLKWVKPAKNSFQIFVSSGTSYEPDFIVETRRGKYLCESKRANEMTDKLVLGKAQAAVAWCTYANQHAIENNGKPWQYLLIPHDQIQDQMTLAGLAARYQFSCPK